MSNNSNENYSCIIDNLLYYGNKKPALKDEELYNIGIRAIICLLPKESHIEHNSNKFSVLNIKTYYYFCILIYLILIIRRIQFYVV